VFKRVGNDQDGGYIVCDNFFNQSEALLNFGIEGRDSFGCDITSRYPMPNYQYDCTTNVIPTCETNNGGNVYYPVCVGEVSETTEKYTYYTLWDILKSHDLVKKHISIKIDTEGGEHTAFRYFPTEFLDYVDQIIMEVHLDFIYQDVWGNLDFLRTISEKFINVNYHMTNYAACYTVDYRGMPARAFELTLVNKKLIKLNS
jgi:hypothetical protein